MLHSTAVFPPIYNGLVCWEILNRILLFKSMFEEIWNRKINKINKSMFEMKVTGTQLWALIFCKSCLRFGRSDVMKTFGMCGTYFPKYRTITSGTNFFFAVHWLWANELWLAQVIFMLKVEGKKVCRLLLLWAHFPCFHYFRPTCIFPWAPQACCGVYLKDAMNNNESITYS